MKRKTARRAKKAVAALLAAAMMAPSLSYMRPVTAYAVAAGCTQSHNTTGLKWSWTDIRKTSGEIFGWPRKLWFKGGTGKWTGLNGKYVFCIANHSSGNPPMWTEADIIQELMINNYKLFKGSATDDKDLRKMHFCLAAAAAENANRGVTLSGCESQTSTTWQYICGQSMLIAVEGRYGFSIDSLEYESAKQKYIAAMDAEFSVGKDLDSAVNADVLANRDKFFEECWAAAEVMYNAIQSSGSGEVANTYAVTQGEDASTYTMTVKCIPYAWETYEGIRLRGRLRGIRGASLTGRTWRPRRPSATTRGRTRRLPAP